MLAIDGSRGEGGGQVLRTALALSLVTKTPFRIANIRAGRSRPGILKQHLAAVRAAARVGNAEVEGAALGSREVVFRPGEVSGGHHELSVGSAGSATLVLQTVLPALLRASGPTTLVIEGGTHNPHAPPFDFLERAFLPVLARMGARVAVALERPGFYPRGGGRLRATVEPAPALARLDLLERGALLRTRAVARVAAIPPHVADRELATLERALGWERRCLRAEVLDDAFGPGNVVVAEVQCEHATEVFCGFGERGVRAEDVARGVVALVRAYLAAGVPVGPHLADQILLPMALAGGGSFRTVPLTPHTRTQIDGIRDFLSADVAVEEEPAGAVRIEVRARGPRATGTTRGSAPGAVDGRGARPL